MARHYRSAAAAFAIVSTLASICSVAQSQPVADRGTGRDSSVVGNIIDASTGKPIAQAQITLRSSTLRASSDLNGHFGIRAVPPARYTIDVRRIGYEPLSRDSITVTSGTTTRLTPCMRRSPRTASGFSVKLVPATRRDGDR